jgi:hypothetical protein
VKRTMQWLRLDCAFMAVAAVARQASPLASRCSAAARSATSVDRAPRTSTPARPSTTSSLALGFSRSFGVSL